MTTIDNENVGESSNVFYCEKCDYTTGKKYNIDKHFLTSKHLKTTNNNDLVGKSSKKTYMCEKCEKVYNDRAGLWRHNKKCAEQYTTSTTVVNHNHSEPSDKDLIMLLIKENSELKTMMMKVIENGTNNTTHTNSHNKSFNLQFFLNETCKDAMNIMDFVDSIKLQLSDLEQVGELGYVEGISNIIVKNLNEMDVTQRPVHCTDKKRETMYIKDEDKWEKDEENSKIKKVIKRVASKNQRLITKFKEVHPDCMKYHSRYSDQYNKIIVESMGGSGNNDIEKEEKIVRNISKNVIVDK